MPIYSSKRLSRLTGLSLSLSMSAADEIGKSQKQKQQQQESWKGSVTKSQNLKNKAECGVSACCSKGNGVSRSTRSISSRPRSVSPPKNRVSYDWEEFSSIEIEGDDNKNDNSDDLLKKQKTSRRWNLRDLLYRSSSEGSYQRKDRERLLSAPLPPAGPSKRKTKAIKPAEQLGAGKIKPAEQLEAGKLKPAEQLGAGKPINGGSTKTKLTSPCASPTHSLKNNRSPVTKHGGAMSSHELYYQTNRAQAEELKRKSFLPYRQGLLGCMGPFPTTSSNHHTMQPSTC